MTQPTPPATETPSDLVLEDQHLATICEQAGLRVMVGILQVVRDRDEVSHETLMALTADDIEPLYEGFVVRAVNNVESSLLGDFD